MAPILAHLCVALLLIAAPPAADDPRVLLGELRAQLQAGRLAEARATALRYVAVDPDNADVWYNLAGLQEQAGDRAAAVAALKRAAAAGFDDFRFAEADRDLGDLRFDPAFAALVSDWSRALRDRAQERALSLTAGQWSTWRDLPDRQGGSAAPAVGVRLRCGADELEIEAQVDDPHPVAMLPPWQQGAGLVVAVLAPPSGATADGDRFHEVAAGLQNKLPVGALLVREPGGVWQPLVELTPELHFDPAADRLVYRIRIPWAALPPEHPLLDEELRLNITCWSVRKDGGRACAALLFDPGSTDAAAGWRRGVPLKVSWPPQSGPALRVRLADNVVSAPQQLAGTLAAVVPTAGHSTWTAQWLLPSPFAPVTAGGGDLAATAGRQERTFHLEAGTVVPRTAGVWPLVGSIDVTEPPLTSQQDVLYLPAEWKRRVESQIAAMPPAERPSLAVRFDAVARELRTRHPLDPIGPLATTVAEVETILTRVAATGTSLPASGPFLAFLPGAAGNSERPCHLQLPPGFRRDESRRLVLIFIHAPGQEARGPDLGLRTLAEGAPSLEISPSAVAIAVPGACGQAPPRPEEAAATVAQTVEWARAVLPGVPLALVGVDEYAAPVLQASLAAPAGLVGVLLMSGRDLAAWTGSDFARGSREVPYAWIRFPAEATADDRGGEIIAAMRAAGLRLAQVQEVPGDLHPSQVWGRAAVWAGGLPQRARQP